MHPVHEFVVGDNESDRLDRMIARAVPGLSRTAARRLIAAGAVFVNRQRCKIASRIVSARDRVAVQETVAGPPAAEVGLTVLYEDAALIAIDKPCGMPSAPTRAAAAGTALDVVQRQLRQQATGGTRAWFVHRLDADTSGVLVLAKTRPAAAALSRAFQERAVTKTYVARVSGSMSGDAGRIDLALDTHARTVVPTAGGQPARTDWRVLARDATTTLLELEPHTGRMHQLRVHLGSVGHPVLGDRRYGGPSAPRLMLHALRIRFAHPLTAATTEIVTSWPAAFGGLP